MGRNEPADPKSMSTKQSLLFKLEIVMETPEIPNFMNNTYVWVNGSARKKIKVFLKLRPLKTILKK